MEPDIAYVPEFDVVKAKAEGELNNQTGIETAQKATDIASKHKCGKILFDFTEMEVTAPILEIYDSPSFNLTAQLQFFHFSLILIISINPI